MHNDCTTGEQMKTEITQYTRGTCKRCDQVGLINEYGFCADCAIKMWRKK